MSRQDGFEENLAYRHSKASFNSNCCFTINLLYPTDSCFARNSTAGMINSLVLHSMSDEIPPYPPVIRAPTNGVAKSRTVRPRS